MKHEEFLDVLAKLGNGSLSDTTLKACEKYVCNFYGKAKLFSVHVRVNYVARMWNRADSQKPCDVGPVGHGCVFDVGTYKIQWYDGDQLPFDIYRALDMDTQASVVEEAEDEEVTYGEDLYGLDETFDTLSHEILCNKLNHYGIRGIALEWIRDYLSNRKQYVIYNNVKSPIENVVIGVPQGSILGPLVFLLYVNDMSNGASNLSFIQYVDDTSIFVKGSSLLSIYKIMNNGMKQVNEWLKNNRLSLNVSKTNYMIMSGKGKKFNKNDCEIMIDNYTLKCVDRINCVGLILNNKFTWKYHIDHIYKKVCRTIGSIVKARIILDIDSIVMLYSATVKPYFICCNIIWGNTFTTYLKKSEKLQKKILRGMTSSEYNSHTGPLFHRLKLMTIKDLYEYSSRIYIYKSVHRLFLQYFGMNLHLVRQTDIRILFNRLFV